MPCFAIEKSRLKEKNEKFKTDIAVMLVLGKGYHIFFLGKLHMHLVGLELRISPFIGLKEIGRAHV